MSDRDISHINRALPTSGHRPAYNSHKFFARKQGDVVSEYIKNYTSEGEIVLDPFCGSGIHVIEAVGADRRAIGVDINPFSAFISRATIRSIEPETIKKTFRKIGADIGDEVDSLYTTKCRECGNEIPAICFTWNDGELVDARYDCPHHDDRAVESTTDSDKELYQNVVDGEFDEFFDDNGDCKFFYPTNELYYDDGTPFLEKQQYESVDDLFTKRNLVALAKILDRIEDVPDDDIRESFKFAFTSMLHLATKMTPVRPSRPFSSAWTQHSYWSADNFMESNVWNLFERAVMKRQSLLSAKKDLPDSFNEKKEGETIEEVLNRAKDYTFITGDAIETLDSIEEDTIDYVITDPPYGESIQYGELLYMWEAWLRMTDDFDNIARNEIVVNSRQNKDDEEYENMLYVAFRRIYDVLKSGRYCTVTFHNPKLKYRNILFRAVVRAGFEFGKIVYQPPPRPSAKGL